MSVLLKAGVLDNLEDDNTEFRFAKCGRDTGSQLSEYATVTEQSEAECEDILWEEIEQ